MQGGKAKGNWGTDRRASKRARGGSGGNRLIIMDIIMDFNVIGTNHKNITRSIWSVL
jgi:hypothetical protein